MKVIGLDHVQLAIPPGGEPAAREFYGGLLGLEELPKPDHLAKRGGCWFALGPLQLHLGVEDDFRPARKAHVGLLVDDLPAVVARLDAAGHHARSDQPLAGYERTYVGDPFGNRIELMQRVG